MWAAALSILAWKDWFKEIGQLPCTVRWWTQAWWLSALERRVPSHCNLPGGSRVWVRGLTFEPLDKSWRRTGASHGLFGSWAAWPQSHLRHWKLSFVGTASSVSGPQGQQRAPSHLAHRIPQQKVITWALPPPTLPNQAEAFRKTLGWTVSWKRGLTRQGPAKKCKTEEHLLNPCSHRLGSFQWWVLQLGLLMDITIMVNNP